MIKKLACFSASLILLATCFPVCVLAEEAVHPICNIKLEPSAITDSKDTEIKVCEGDTDVSAVTREGGYIEWQATITETGYYCLSLEYFTLPGNGMDYEVALQIDGEYPFESAKRVVFPRIWELETAKNGRFATDNRGNELLPPAAEKLVRVGRNFADHAGMDDTKFSVLLSEGVHTIKITAVREQIAVCSLSVYNNPPYESYAKTLAKWESQYGKPKGSHRETFEAEIVNEISNSAILPGYDRTSPATSPNSPKNIRLNTIGGKSWQQSGQWIVWDFTVPEDGYYQFSYKYRQDLIRGLSVTRKVTIDGISPYCEFKSMQFPYTDGWEQITPSDNEGLPLYVYLTKGTHQLKLEAALGEMAETLKASEEVVRNLNDMYRRIIMVTGVSPDTYRDYYFSKEIPELTKVFKASSKTLKEQAGKLQKMYGKGNETTLFYELAAQLDSFCKDDRTISARLDRFKSNIGALAELVFNLKNQPLELDYFTVSQKDSAADKTDSSFFANLWFRTRYFLYSFMSDYAQVGNVYGDEALDIWVSVSDMTQTGAAAGREQAQLLKHMVDDYFTRESEIPVNLSLANTSEALLQAIISGNGPDVAMFVPKASVMNLGVRDALAPVSDMKNFSEIKSQFLSASLTGFTLKDKVFALPDTLSYNMMFYRTDIFDEQGLTPPATWKEFNETAAILNKKNMQVGISENQSVFEMFLLQNGADIYNKDNTQIALHTPEALSAFRQWTDLYVQYSLPVAFDFFNRFRTGEMPVGIVPLSTYNQLCVGAPELKGLWKMAPVPGNGENRAESVMTTGSIVIKNSKQEKNAFTFLEWWSSGDTQKRFGNQLEVLLGTSSRYNTANTEAFSKLAWTADELSALRAQQEVLSDFAVTPASYFVTRNITNAFRRVVYYYENPSEVMNRYSEDMNKELVRKNKEFGLD